VEVLPAESVTVMEYVPGVPITYYCDQKKMNIRVRLDLLIEVCG
jgi:hypothetical protein